MNMVPPKRGARTRTRTVKIGNREIQSKGLAQSFWSDVYHRSMTTNWPVFLAGAVAVFVATNALFATLFMLGTDPIANLPPGKPWHVLYFSMETLATVGYGDMHPQTEYAHIVASIETFSGVLFSAVITGLIFARFSRPRAKILFSKHLIIGRHDGQPCLMARAANARQNTIADAKAKLWVLISEPTASGRPFRRFRELSIARSENPSFILSWTIFHVIDESSPLYGLGPADLEAKEVSFVLSISGADEGVAQEARSRHSYRLEDLVWNKQFADIISNNDAGKVEVDYGKFHDIEDDDEV